MSSAAYVSMYEREFREAFSHSLDALDTEPFEQSVKKIVERIADDVVYRVHDDVRDRLISSIGDSICAKAAEVATRMLESALAGDEKEIKQLFGFYDYREGGMAHMAFHFSPKPQRWQLIEALMERGPDVFIDERIGQLGENIVARDREIERLRKTVDFYRALSEGREPGEHP
jgi:hypothetical protein